MKEKFILAISIMAAIASFFLSGTVVLYILNWGYTVTLITSVCLILFGIFCLYAAFTAHSIIVENRTEEIDRVNYCQEISESEWQDLF